MTSSDLNMTSPFNWKNQPSIFQGPEFDGGKLRMRQAATRAVDEGRISGTIYGLSPNSVKRLRELGVRNPRKKKESS